MELITSLVMAYLAMSPQTVLDSDSALQAVEVMSNAALSAQVTSEHIYLKFICYKTPLVSLSRLSLINFVGTETLQKI